MPFFGLAAERCASHCCRLRLRGKGYFASRINRYTNSTSSFQLVRLVISGSICPNPGPNKTSVSTKSDKRNRRCQSDPLHNIKIAHLNIRSLKNREHYILAKEAVRANKLDIFTVSETWLDSTVSDIEVGFPGFHFHRLDRNIQTGGGVCIFTKQGFKVERLHELSYIAASGLHMLWVKIQIRNWRSFLVCTVYKPPDTSTLCFDTDFSETLVKALSLNKPIFILGDLNCNMLNDNDPACQALTSFCSSFNLLQLITQPTRITQNSETLICVPLASNGNLVMQTKVVPLSISDHELICATLKLKKERTVPVYVTKRSFKHYDHQEFLRDMSSVPWSVVDCFDDVEDRLDAFNLLFNEVLDRHAPIRKIKVRNRPNPFVTDEIRGLMKTRDKWCKEARKTKDPLAWDVYKSLRQEVKRKLKIAEREYVAEQIKQNPNNPRCIWKTIRSCIPKKSRNQRTFSKDDKSVANEFNTFFSSVGQATVDKINSLADECKYNLAKPGFKSRAHGESEQFAFHTVECKQIQDIISAMPTNKAPGIDKISMRVVKDSLPVILPTLTSIINASFVTGTFPSLWKMAEVTPIPKEGDHEKPNNNRPVSLLPTLSKVCEKVALNQFMAFLESKQRLSTEQSGKKRFHSTETSLTDTTDVILEAIDKQEVTAVVLLGP